MNWRFIRNAQDKNWCNGKQTNIAFCCRVYLRVQLMFGKFLFVRRETYIQTKSKKHFWAHLQERAGKLRIKSGTRSGIHLTERFEPKSTTEKTGREKTKKMNE